MASKEAIEKFIKDAPPGEVGAVQKDINSITDSEGLKSATKAAISQYLEESFMPVKLADNTWSIISKYNKKEGEYFSENSVFVVDYNSTSDKFARGSIKSSSGPGLSSSQQSLKASVGHYVSSHFPSESAFDVFPQSDGTTVLVWVDYKFSPENFWNGKWVSVYTVDSSSNVKGEILIDVHYFEDGNVRLKSSKKIELSGSNVVSSIAKAESEFQAELNRSLIGLNEKQFKALRRQLPVTRSKVNWGKAIGNYKLGKDIAGQ